MADSQDLIARFQTVMSGPSEENIASLGELVADDVNVVGMLGAGADKETVLAGLNNPMVAALFGSATWDDPDVDGNTVTLTARLPAGAPIGGMIFELAVDGSGTLAQVLEEMIPAATPAAGPLVLSDEIKQQVNGAHENGTPIVWAYINADGTPVLTFRGSTQAYSDDQLAIWNRDPTGGMTKAIASNPKLGGFFRSATNGMIYQFAGRARIDESANDVVYANAPEPERNADARKRGVAVIIDLDRVESLGLAGRFVLERGA